MAKDTNAQLESEIEEIRMRLAGTIDDLVTRSHPRSIVSRQLASIKAAYVDPVTGEPQMETIYKTAGVVGGVVGFFVVIRLAFRR